MCSVRSSSEINGNSQTPALLLKQRSDTLTSLCDESAKQTDLSRQRATDPGTEIGLAYGRSALAIGVAVVPQGNDGAKHVIIDAYQDQFEGAGWEAVVGVGLDVNCTLLEERSQLALPRLVTEGFVADASFVDGSHIFHNVFVDLHFLRELVRPGGVVVLDDCKWPSVATAVHCFEVNAGWVPLVMPQPTRLRAFRLPNPRREPACDTFEPFGLV